MDNLNKPTAPKISIIVPVYNAAPYLEECLNSLVHQTLNEIEIICIDDGSTDASLEILKIYQQKDARIIILEQKNQKQGAARNRGLEIARGEYIQFVDSDDYIDLKTCENLYNKCHDHHLDMLSFRGVNFLDNTREFLESPFYEFRYLPLNWDKDVFNYQDCLDFLPKMVTSTALTIYKASFIKEKGITFPEKLYFEDNVFFVKSIIQAKRVSIDKNLYYYRRIHSHSTTKNWNIHFNDYLQIVDILLNFIAESKTGSIIYNSYRDLHLRVASSYYKRFSHADRVKYKIIYKQWLEKYKVKKHKVSDIIKAYLFFPYFLYKSLVYKGKMKKAKKNRYDDVPITHEGRKRPKVSIIMPVYNVEKYLHESLKSVVNQTLKDIEIICINDGSTDHSLDIIKEFARTDKRIKYIDKPNSGLGHTLNCGLDIASGEYIGIVETDDFAKENMYATLYKKAKKYDLDVVKANFLEFESRDDRYIYRVKKLSNKSSYYKTVFHPADFRDVLFRFTLNQAGIYKKEFIEKFHIRHNETPGAAYQDNGFWVQTMYLAERIMFLDSPLYCYRVDNPNQSIKKRNNLWDIPREYDFIDRLFDKIPSLAKYRKIYTYRKFLAYMYHLHIRISTEYWPEYLKKMSEHFRLENDKGYIDPLFYTPKELSSLHLILNEKIDEYMEKNIPKSE